jgi:D-sedoheptulose 7-phosphate isomerase
MSFTKDYINDVQKLVGQVDITSVEKALAALWAAYQKGNKIFLFGNGGSAATAMHIVNDIVKGTTIESKKAARAYCLSDNTSLLMAIANDISYDDVFVHQLKAYFDKGDVAVGISGSGNSENVIRAIKYANENGGVTIGLTGFEGGKLQKMAQIPIHVAAKHYGKVEDVHTVICHVFGYYFMSRAKE